MADPRFFTNAGPQMLGNLAASIGAVLAEGGDPETSVSDVAPLDEAGEGHISFLDNVKYKESFTRTKATACIIAPEMEKFAPKGVHLLISKTPYKAYALTAALFYPSEKPPAKISGKAHVESDCRIGEGCIIEEGVVIRSGVEVGAGSWIGSNSVIDKNVVIGAGCQVGANTTISHTLIGDNVRLYPGCRIGQDGFGFAIDPAGHVKVPQLGRVIIEDNVEIGANTTIDRGAGPDTVIGRGTWIDNLVQIGHNVKIGKGCIIVAQVGVSGSTIIEDFAILAGQAGIAGHLHIGKGAQVGAQSGVMRDIPAGQQVMGSPALPKREYMRQISTLHRLVTKKNG